MNLNSAVPKHGLQDDVKDLPVQNGFEVQKSSHRLRSKSTAALVLLYYRYESDSKNDSLNKVS